MTPEEIADARDAAYAIARSRRVSHHDAEDAAQVAVVRMLRRLRERGSLPNQATSFAGNNAWWRTLDMQRKEAVAAKYRPKVAERVEWEPTDTLEEAESREAMIVRRVALRAAVSRLPPRTRAVIHGVLEGLDSKSIAERLGMSTNTVRQRAYQARQRLREQLADLEV